MAMSSIKRVFLSGLCLSIVFVLFGCAGIPNNTGSGPVLGNLDDVRTDIDDSQNRIKAKKRLELAMAYLQSGKATFALDNVKQAIKHDPSYTDAFNVKGLIYMRMDEPKLAEESFKQALSISALDVDVLNNYAWFSCQHKEYAKSFPLFEKAIAHSKNLAKAKALANLGICQLRANKAQDAEKSLIEADSLDKSNPYIAYSLAQVYWALTQYDKADLYAKQINNGDQANAESLWLGIKIARARGNRKEMQQLGAQLGKRFGGSSQAKSWQEGAFNE